MSQSAASRASQKTAMLGSCLQSQHGISNGVSVCCLSVECIPSWYGHWIPFLYFLLYFYSCISFRQAHFWVKILKMGGWPHPFTGGLVYLLGLNSLIPSLFCWAFLLMSSPLSPGSLFHPRFLEIWDYLEIIPTLYPPYKLHISMQLNSSIFPAPFCFSTILPIPTPAPFSSSPPLSHPGPFVPLPPVIIITSLFCTFEWHATVSSYHISLFHSLVDGNLGDMFFSYSVKQWRIWLNMFLSHSPWSPLANMVGQLFWENLQTNFQSCNASLHYHLGCMRGSQSASIHHLYSLS